MPLVMLIAPSGVGKTTACLQCVARAQAIGMQAAGLLTVPQPAGMPPHPSALWLQDAASGKRRLLAHVAGPAEAAVGKWRFVPAVVSWGNALLKTIRRADFLVMDEIGPWELRQGCGFVAAFEALCRFQGALAVVTVRPTLADALAGRLAACRPHRVRLTAANREALPQMLLP